MTENREPHYTENVQDHLQQVQHLLEKQALVESVVHHQEIPRDDRHELVDNDFIKFGSAMLKFKSL